MSPMLALALALIAGALIGLALGVLGGGGSILAVPVLVYLLGQSPSQATTGSLVVVAVTSLLGAITARRRGNVLLGRGVAFGVVGVGGAALGATLATGLSEPVLMLAFSVLMASVGTLMLVRQWRHRRTPPAERGPRPGFDDPIITFSPRFACACPRALRVLVTATAVGFLTGLLGVGGGFLVVPALLIALSLPIRYAAGTSLVVITVTSLAALGVRVWHGTASPDWWLVGALTVASAGSAILGVRLAGRVRVERLNAAFTALVLSLALFIGLQAAPGLA